MFTQLGSFGYRHRHTIVAAWGLLLLFGVSLAAGVDTNLHTTVGSAPTEASDGLILLQDELGVPPSAAIVVYHSDFLTVHDSEFRGYVERSLAGVREMEATVRIDTPYSLISSTPVTPDGRTTYVLVWLDLPTEEAIRVMPELRTKLGLSKRPTPAPPNGPTISSESLISIMVTGAPAIFGELEAATARDLRRGEMVAIPLVLIALVLIFGGLVASALPVLMGGVSLVLSLGAMSVIGMLTDMSIFAKNVASLLALGIAVDYSLFMVSRFREELERRGVEASLVTTMATAGRSVLFSGVTTICGLSGLLLVQFSFLRSLGIAGIVVVIFSLAVALTLVPAILGILGHRIDALPLFPRQRGRSAFWKGLATMIMSNPLPVLVSSTAFLVILGLPFLGLRLGPIWSGTLPSDAPARQAWEFARQRFGAGALAPMVVVVQTQGSIWEPRNIGALFDYSRRLADVPGVIRVDSIVDLAPGITREAYQIAYRDLENLTPEMREMFGTAVHGSTTVLRVLTPHDAAAPESRDIVHMTRSVPITGGMTRHVTGTAASLQDSIDALYGDFPKVAVFVIGSIYLALVLLFRSVVLALKAVIMNGLGILATFGSLVWIFQEGHLQGLLGFRAEGTVAASLPILLFCIVFGLSMDYGLFLLSRIKEEYDRTGDNAASVASGMEKSGRIITSASTVVVTVGCAFALGDVILIKALGLGLAIAVLIDATVIRALMVPSIMRLLGSWNWWAPQPLLRLLPQWEYLPD